MNTNGNDITIKPIFTSPIKYIPSLYEVSNNKIVRFMASRDKQYNFTKKADTVMIVPEMIINDQNYLVIIKEFRHGINQYEISFPCGMIDENESIEETARRELKEETSLDIETINYISPILYKSSGFSNETQVTLYCLVSGHLMDEVTQSNYLEEDEDIEVLVMSMAELAYMIATESYNNTPITFSSSAFPIILNYIQ